MPPISRIKSLDLLRGLTVAAMIMVNNSGGHGSFHPLQHSSWNGLTLCDMVFPTFLFIVGISTYLSLCKSGFAFSRHTMYKIARRTLIILLIGWAIHYLDHAIDGNFMPWGNLRLTGVLPRIAVCYFITASLAITCGKRTIYAIIVLVIVGYGALLLFGNGYASDESSILVKIDRYLLSPGHMYSKKPVDPEGVASTLCAIAHCLIGFCFGSVLADKETSSSQRLLRIMVYGFVLLLIGLVAEQAFPVNKRIWSPSYTLITCALGALSLGTLGYFTDLKGYARTLWPLDVFGVNPLFLYALSEVTAILLGSNGISEYIFCAISSIIPSLKFAALSYSLLFVAVMWIAGFILYKHHIYIKI